MTFDISFYGMTFDISFKDCAIYRCDFKNYWFCTPYKVNIFFCEKEFQKGT